ncbi:hypothetical protein IJZ97_01340 [bacterium]|nr:hypothetical protein [bacterium]
MRKILVFLALIFAFICGLPQSEAASYSYLKNDAIQIEAIDNNIKKPVTQPSDKYFISNNIQNNCEYIFEGFGSVANNNFNVEDLFISHRQNLKSYSIMDEYLLSISSNPRAP